MVPGPKKWVKPSVAKHQARAVEYFAKKFGTSPRTEAVTETAQASE